MINQYGLRTAVDLGSMDTDADGSGSLILKFQSRVNLIITMWLHFHIILMNLLEVEQHKY